MSAIMGKKSGGDAFLDSAIKIIDLIPDSPITPLAAALADVFTDGWEEAGKTAVAGVVPDIAKPIAQIGANRDFRNLPFLNQWANKALSGYKKIRINRKGEACAPSFPIDLAKLTDHATGGDGAKKAGDLGTLEHWELSGLIRQIKQMEGMLDELQAAQKDKDIEITGLKRDLIMKYRGR
jgi:hypothetical protein